MEYITRETGAFPLSMGTSLALEGLLGVHPSTPPAPAHARRVREVWINIRTLIRNLFSAMTAEQAEKAPLQEVLDLLVLEMETIDTVLLQQGKGRLGVVFYCNDLEELKWVFPHAQWKTPRTKKQITAHKVEEILVKQLQTLGREGEVSLREIKREPPIVPKAVALLTHYPCELLWRFQFEVLFLLESHTGRLKPYSQWCSKLKGVRADEHLPFNRLSLQLFGDGVLLEGCARPLREEFKQLAETRRWTAVTSLEKIQDDIHRYGGEKLRALTATLMKR